MNAIQGCILFFPDTSETHLFPHQNDVVLVLFWGFFSSQNLSQILAVLLVVSEVSL